jgi:hypothetical protein
LACFRKTTCPSQGNAQGRQAKPQEGSDLRPRFPLHFPLHFSANCKTRRPAVTHVIILTPASLSFLDCPPKIASPSTTPWLACIMPTRIVNPVPSHKRSSAVIVKQPAAQRPHFLFTSISTPYKKDTKDLHRERELNVTVQMGKDLRLEKGI